MAVRVRAFWEDGRPSGSWKPRSLTSAYPVIGQNPDQTPRGPECYCLFTTITAEAVSFTLVSEDEVAIETLAVLSRRRIPTSCTCGAGTVVRCLRYLWRQDEKASLLYRIAAVLLLFFAVGHTLAFRQSDPTWGVDTLLGSMRSIHFDVQGFSRTYWDLFVAAGFSVGVFYLFAAVLAWQPGGLPAETLAVMRVTVWALALCFAAITVVSWRYSDNDCLDVPRRFIDEGEDVHQVKKERRQC